MGGEGANGIKTGISCPYNKQQFSSSCRPWCTWEHWNRRAQMWLFWPSGYSLARSFAARTHWGTRASIFNCTTWLSMASGVNQGLSVCSTLVFGTGFFCRCTQSCTTWTSAQSHLWPQKEWIGLDGEAAQLLHDLHLPVERKAGWKWDGRKCWAEEVQDRS